MNDRPNVLLVVLDCVRYDVLSSYGFPAPTTPNLDRLAAGGVLFENAFAAAPWTPPSHASLFTGAYPSRHGVDVNENLHLGDQLPTLAGILRERGYRTFAAIPDVHLSAVRGFHRGFEETVELWQIPYWKPELDWWSSMAWNFLYGRDKKARYTSRVLRRWIRAHRHEPFFAFVNYKTAHNDYRPPRPWRGRFEQRNGAIDHRRVREYSRRAGYAYMAGRLELSPEEMALVRSWYVGAVAYLDARIGEIVRWLRDESLLDDTIVVVTADHGENLGEHHLAYHMFSLHDTLLHVPLLMAGPGIPVGRRIQSLASLTDVAPTLLELAGHADAAPHTEGASWVPFDDRPRHDCVFAEFGRPRYMLERLARAFPGHDFSPFDRGLRAVRTSRHKLVAGTDGREELYDLEEDPGELRDRGPELPNVADELRLRLESWAANGNGHAPDLGPTHEDDERVSAALRDLGYF